MIIIRLLQPDPVDGLLRVLRREIRPQLVVVVLHQDLPIGGRVRRLVECLAVLLQVAALRDGHARKRRPRAGEQVQEVVDARVQPRRVVLARGRRAGARDVQLDVVAVQDAARAGEVARSGVGEGGPRLAVLDDVEHGLPAGFVQIAAADEAGFHLGGGGGGGQKC